MKTTYVPPTVQMTDGQAGAGEIAQASGAIAVIIIALALNMIAPVP